MSNEVVLEFMSRGGTIKVCRPRKAKGAPPFSSAFGGNRVFLASKAVAGSEQAGMLRMGTGLRKYGN
jgi:hypothetical protein